MRESKDAVEALERGQPIVVAPPMAPSRFDDAHLAQMARAGQLIQAIKIYRDQTGLGLAEAKAAVERLRDAPS